MEKGNSLAENFSELDSELFADLESEADRKFTESKDRVTEESSSKRDNIKKMLGGISDRKLRSEAEAERGGTEEMKKLDRWVDLDIGDLESTPEELEEELELLSAEENGHNVEGGWEDPGEMTAGPERQANNPKIKTQTSKKSSKKRQSEPAGKGRKTLAAASRAEHETLANHDALVRQQAELEDFDDLLAIASSDGRKDNADVLEPLESCELELPEVSDDDLFDITTEMEPAEVDSHNSSDDLELELELDAAASWEDFQLTDDVSDPLESGLQTELLAAVSPGSARITKEETPTEKLDLHLEEESMLSDLELDMFSSSASDTDISEESLSLDSLEELSNELLDSQTETKEASSERLTPDFALSQTRAGSNIDFRAAGEHQMLQELELEMNYGDSLEDDQSLSLDSLDDELSKEMLDLSSEVTETTAGTPLKELELEMDQSLSFVSKEMLDLSSEVTKKTAGEPQMPEELDRDIFSEYDRSSGEVEELSLAGGETATDSWLEMSHEMLDLSSAGTKEVKTSEDEKLDRMWDISASLDTDVASSYGQTQLDMLDMDEEMFASASSTDDIEAILDELDATDFADDSITEDMADDFDLDTIDLETDMELLDDGDPDEGSTGEQTSPAAAENNQWEELEALLGHEEQASLGAAEQAVFARLEEFLDASQDSLQAESTGNEETQSEAGNGSSNSDEFDELEAMLVDVDKLGVPPIQPHSKQRQQPTRPRQPEQNMKVPIKQLDNLSNLVGELVVNRNSLEQNQDRLRTTLDNLLSQVQQLNDVGGRMQDLYERSLLEAALLNSRTSNLPGAQLKETAPSNNQHHTGEEFDVLEMDSFTGFHLLSQEMIELIVRVRESASDIEFIVDETDQVTRQFRQVTTQLQESLTRTRMIPFAQTVDRLPGAVKRICMKLNKQAQIQIEGRETLIDKMIQEHLSDPMTHLINNAMTHGVELPEVRQAAGKPPVGQITIRAFHQGNQTVISVSDDGAGIDAERVKTKAIEKGLMSQEEAKNISRLDLYDLLFHPGFSTKDRVGDLAGRGVGLDVVRTSLIDIRGAINIDSSLGKGTTFTIRLPLTLSISKALCCISNWAKIAFPMDGVEDMLDVPKERISVNKEGQSCIMWRDTQLPFRPLSELLQYNRQIDRSRVFGGKEEEDIVSIVVLRGAGEYIALQVDQVLGEQEIVIKQLEGPVPKPMGVAGATVLGDSRIMPIADVLELIDLSKGRSRREISWDYGAMQTIPEVPQIKTEPTVLIVDDSITVRELLSMTFNKAGYRVEQARDGQDAWDKLRSGLPCDIIFCDIEMPRMDGLELLDRLQKDEHLNHMPMAMLTSRGADKHRQRAANSGAKGYFTKPYLEEALLEAAQRMLKGEVPIAATS